jgi:DNA-binding IclR family transcriptional regulator
VKSNISIQAADRILQILAAFTSEGQELSVGAFAERLGVHKSSASRLAATLAGRGFLEQDPRSRSFRLGAELSRLGSLASGGRKIEALARETMETLARETGETVNLGVLERDQIINVAQVDGDHIVGVGMWTGKRTPLHCTSNGKVMLAFAGAKLPAGALKALTRRTITDVRKLNQQLEAARRHGWACAQGELEDGLYAVAAPIFDAFERCRAAISVSAPSYRMSVKNFPEIARLCMRAARDVETRLGRTK